MSTNHTTGRGLGLAVAVPRDVIVTAADSVARSGYSSFWLNNPPGKDALGVLGSVAPLVPALHLGVGVIPLSAGDPEQIAAGVQRARLPLDRLYLGIGSGAGSGGVQRVEAGIQRLRTVFDGYIVVAALGPKMCRLAGATADGVLFNWLTPAYAEQSIGWVRAGAEQAERPVPRVFAYVRVGLGEGAIERLRLESATYESYPAYADHFRRMGTGAMDTSIAASGPGDIQTRLSAWDGLVDEVVVRAITAHDTTDEVQRLIQAAGLH